MEVAAEHDAENVLEAAHYNTTNHRSGLPRPGRAESNGNVGSRGRQKPASLWQSHVQGSRAGLQSARESCLTSYLTPPL